MKDLLIKQVQFEFWANSELLNNLKMAEPLNPRALFLFSHLLSAGSMWLNRLKNEALTTTLFQERTVEECEILLGDLKTGWGNYFEPITLENLNKIIEFASSVDNFKRSIKTSDAIMHVVHHSSYHRGQIITLLKGSIEQLPLITYMPFASIEM
jgi:uncharacterized damage-inducible protein DinB